MKKIAIFLLAFSLFLAGCATTKDASDGGFPVYVTNRIKVPLFPTEFMDGEIDLFELFEGDFSENKFSSNILFASNQKSLSLILLNSFGATIGNLFYDGKTLDFESSFFPKNFKAQYVVFDIQLAFYNADLVKKELKKHKLDFEAKKTDGENETRLLKEKGKLITEIKTENEKTTITNHLRGYTYVITNLGM